MKKQEARKKLKQDANKVWRVCYAVSFVYICMHVCTFVHVSPQDFLPFKRWAGGEICLHQIAKCTDLDGEVGWIVWLSSKKIFKIPISDHSLFKFVHLMCW